MKKRKPLAQDFFLCPPGIRAKNYLFIYLFILLYLFATQ